MKRLFVWVLLLGTTLAAMSQEDKLQVETYYLNNGMKVVLAEEHSQPQIHGGILVHAGSKNEDPNATGVAHYFEHIMFKGTDKIGTTNWEVEKVYLDSISNLYDQLHAAKDEQQRTSIQKEINRLNLAASKYAIPNEVDAILSKIGCTGVNAGTSYDITVYYNTLPANQLETWMDIYVERFRNPVFRLFQSELEAVYEEKNMYEDSPVYKFSRMMFTESFGEHPYSRDVIGLGEHLKNPQPSEMQRFFDTYYVANNMTLLLVGDFNIEKIKPLIAKKFGTMRTGKLPEQKQYKMNDFATAQVKNVKLTPLPMGMILFPGVASNHKDNLGLSMVNQILSSGSNGLLDKANNDGKFLFGVYTASSLIDGGINAVLYAPNILQKHEVAEKAVWDCIDSVKEGNFSDDLLTSIKTKLTFDRLQQTETMDNIVGLLLSLEMSGSSYQQWLDENDRIAKMTKKDIMEIASRYLDRNHCTTIRSKIGFPDKDVVAKPDWKHLEAQNIGEQSDFAKEIYSRPVEETQPQVIDFNKDVMIIPTTSHTNLYAVKNPKNNIFYLDLNYRYGSIDNPDLDRALTYFDQLGAGDMDAQQFQTKLSMCGGSLYVSNNDEYTTISIQGFEEHFDEIMHLVKLKIDSPVHDNKQIDRIVEAALTDKKSVKNDATSWAQALVSYVTFGSNSEYLRKTPIKTWKERGGFDVMNDVKQIFKRNGYITLCGNIPADHVSETCKALQFVKEDDVTVVKNRTYKRLVDTTNRVYYCTNKQFGQSNIYINVASDDIKDRKTEALSAMFNAYFGSGMNSLMFQEIREFRSLGYATAARFIYDIYHINNGRLTCFLGTQCDKTNEGVEAIVDLFTNMPLREDKFVVAKDYLISSNNSQYYNFRQTAEAVYQWREVQGYDYDPRVKNTDMIRKMTIDDVAMFQKKYIAGRPITIMISGNTKRFNKKALAQYGLMKEVKFKEMFRF